MMMVVFKIAWLASCRPLCLGCCSRAYLRSLVDGQEMKIPCPHSAGCKHTVVILHVLFKFLHHKIKRNDVGHFFFAVVDCGFVTKCAVKQVLLLTAMSAHLHWADNGPENSPIRSVHYFSIATIAFS